MSYDKTVENKVVQFCEEKDYLNCRLQYLFLQESDICSLAPTFLHFIQCSLHEENCGVENIVSLIDYYVPTESSFTVGNDSGNIFSGNTVQFSQGQDVHIEGNLVVSGEVTSSNIIGTTTDTTGQYNADAYAGSVPAPSPEIYTNLSASPTPSEIDAAFGSFAATANEIMARGGLLPLSGVSKERITEKPPADPIEHRWEILDLRGDDNEHD